MMTLKTQILFSINTVKKSFCNILKLQKINYTMTDYYQQIISYQ